MDNPYRPPVAESVAPVLDGSIPDTLPLASPWRRLGAAMIDNFAYGVCFSPFIVGALVAESAPEGAQAPILIGSGLLSGALAIGLFAVTIRWWLQYGQSPGKRVLDLRIVHMDGRQAGVSELVFLRWGATLGINMALAVCGMNGIFSLADQLMVFSTGNQTLHDRIAKTVVVDAHYVPPGMEV